MRPKRKERAAKLATPSGTATVRRGARSLIGGIAEPQEMLDFCGEHGIVSDIEMIRIQDIDEAQERMLRSDVKYRFVIDMASLEDEVPA